MIVWRHALSVIPAAALLACLSLLAACGGGGEARPEGLPGQAEQLLTAADIQEYAEGTPERTVYEWWRSAQYADPTGYLEHYEKSLREELEETPNLGATVDVFAGYIRTARPIVREVERKGDRVTLYTEIEFRRPVGTTHYATTTRPQGFTMVRQGGEWRLVDDLYVQESVSALRRAAAE